MAYGAHANVRSHRRGGVRRRRRRFAPWISVTLVSAVVVAGLAIGYRQLLAQTCSGQETVQVLASPTTANLLGSFATEWSAREPQTSDGTCARVSVQARESAEVTAALAAGWDPAEDPPHVWVPASTAWAQKAAASDLAEPLIPDLRPSVARTPTVLAMPEPMAAQLEWPDTRLVPDAAVRWESLLEEFADDDEGWARFGHPEWGEFIFGMSNPARDTAGLLALTAILDSDETGDTTPEELANALKLHRLLDPEAYHETSEQMLNKLEELGEEHGGDAAIRHVSAFPALEQDVLAYNRRDPEVPLAAVYPVNGNIEADHPYLVLNADWVTDRKREVADSFLAYVRTEGPQAALSEAGFRSSRYREPTENHTEQYGLVAQLAALPRAVLVPDSVSVTIDRWTALTQPFNVLIAFDVSGSMLRPIPGTGEIRMERATLAASETVRLFTDEDRLGLWEFSTELDGEVDYRSLVPLGQLGETLGDGRTRRQQTLDAIDGLVPLFDTGLYNTIQAAYDTVLDSYVPDATNMVVIITDGEDDTQGRPGISRDALLDHLQSAATGDEEVQVVTVAFGEEPDFEIMKEISSQTGAQAYHSPDGFDLVDLLRTAIFGG